MLSTQFSSRRVKVQVRVSASHSHLVARPSRITPLLSYSTRVSTQFAPTTISRSVAVVR